MRFTIEINEGNKWIENNGKINVKFLSNKLINQIFVASVEENDFFSIL